MSDNQITGLAVAEVYVDSSIQLQEMINKFHKKGIEELHIKAILENAIVADPDFDEEAAKIAYLLGARANLSEIVVDYRSSDLGQGVNLIFTAKLLKEKEEGSLA